MESSIVLLTVILILICGFKAVVLYSPLYLGAKVLFVFIKFLIFSTRFDALSNIFVHRALPIVLRHFVVGFYSNFIFEH